MLCGESACLCHPAVIPFVHFAFRLKPISEIRAVFASALMPQLVGTLSNLLLQTHALIHMQRGPGSFFVRCSIFHKGFVGFRILGYFAAASAAASMSLTTSFGCEMKAT